MQMFLWDDDMLVTINGGTLEGTYAANDANFTDTENQMETQQELL